MGHPASVSITACGDIAITAAEGGTGYWGMIDEYRPSRWHRDDDLNAAPRDDLPDTFVYYTIRDMEPDPEDRAPVIEVTPALIRRGYRLAWDKYRHVLDDDGPEYADATGADMVIQLGAWGEIVYG